MERRPLLRALLDRPRMRYQFKGADGKICCRTNNPDHLCAACKAQAHGQARPLETRTLRAAATADEHQAKVNLIHDASARLMGAKCGSGGPTTAEGRRHSAKDLADIKLIHDTSVADGAACADATDDAEPSAAEQWKEHLDRLDLPVPDAYAALEGRREEAGILTLTADLDPRYKPYGQPPDGYAIGLAARKLQAEQNAASTATEPRVDLPRDGNGIPDPFAAGLAARRAAR